MKMYIPIIGDKIKLTEDWNLGLYNSYLNETLQHVMGDNRPDHRNPTSVPITIPKGSVLKIDRINIKKNGGDMNSVSFFWVGKHADYGFDHQPDGSTYKIPSRPVRFWAALPDVNGIEFEMAND